MFLEILFFRKKHVIGILCIGIEESSLNFICLIQLRLSVKNYILLQLFIFLSMQSYANYIIC